jgi:hypothetical protein
LLRPRSKTDLKFSIVEHKNHITINNEHLNNQDNDNIYHYRLITNESISIRNNQEIFKGRKKILYKYIMTKVSKTFREYNIVFYLHGGGFLSQTTESHVGYLSK